MYEIHGATFGFLIEPGPAETDADRPVTLHLIARQPGFPNAWQTTGHKFDPDALADLLAQAKEAQHVLETAYTRTPDGYRPRRALL